MDKKSPLNEQLKRHRQLLEYTFYMPEDKDDEDLDGELLFDGNLTEQDPTPGGEPAMDDPFADTEEVPTDELPPEGEEPVMDDPAMEEPLEMDTFAGDEGIEIEDEFATEEPMDGGESVEIDVTDIVDKTEQTNQEVAGLTGKMDELMGKLGDLEQHVTGMDSIIDKIDDLESEIERRNPTPVEKLEMRSMVSFPYSVKLTDFWQDKEGYDTGSEEAEKDYVLTQQDVDDYSPSDVKSSFDPNKDEEEDEGNF